MTSCTYEQFVKKADQILSLERPNKISLQNAEKLLRGFKAPSAYQLLSDTATGLFRGVGLCSRDTKTYGDLAIEKSVELEEFINEMKLKQQKQKAQKQRRQARLQKVKQAVKSNRKSYEEFQPGQEIRPVLPETLQLQKLMKQNRTKKSQKEAQIAVEILRQHPELQAGVLAYFDILPFEDTPLPSTDQQEQRMGAKLQSILKSKGLLQEQDQDIDLDQYQDPDFGPEYLQLQKKLQKKLQQENKQRQKKEVRQLKQKYRKYREANKANKENKALEKRKLQTKLEKAKTQLAAKRAGKKAVRRKLPVAPTRK